MVALCFCLLVYFYCVLVGFELVILGFVCLVFVGFDCLLLLFCLICCWQVASFVYLFLFCFILVRLVA